MATVTEAPAAPSHRERVALAVVAAALVSLLAGYVGGLSGATTGPYPTQPGGSVPVHEAPASPVPSPTPGPRPGL
jgi:hypothetical protein